MKALLILKFFGWFGLTLIIILTIIGIDYLWYETYKDEESWFYIPLQILDDLDLCQSSLQ